MDLVNMEGRQYEQQESLPGSSCMDSDASSSCFEWNESTEAQISNDGHASDEEEDLKEDLQKNIPDLYKSDLNAHSSSDVSNDSKDDEFQTTALCQFMDILNDLDEVLDKSLLSCLDDGTKLLDSDDDDIICKLNECVVIEGDRSGSQSSVDDDTQVVVSPNNQIWKSQTVIVDTHNNTIRRANIGRSKSLAAISSHTTEADIPVPDRGTSVIDTLRTSMRRLAPIVLPTLSAAQTTYEPLTLPVILFLEHHVNMRSTSEPMQLQVATSDGVSGPLVVGRRALLMNRALSLPSPAQNDINNVDWVERNTPRSTERSSSISNSSSQSLGVLPFNQNMMNDIGERSDEVDDPPFGTWPHKMSATLACLSCTVGVYNISRFAMFSVHFGATFIVQFMLLSLLVGIPLLTLHLCLGQVLGAGPIDMWKISPIFQGVGIALLISEAFIGIYSIIGLSWIFVYLKDSFITTDERYKWALPHNVNIEDVIATNMTVKIQETVPQYFYSEVLKRVPGTGTIGLGAIKFHVGLNLTVLWLIVFVSLSKGLKSYGKVVCVLMLLPICGTVILCLKLMTLIPYEAVTNIFSETQWREFFINSNSWTAATQETFLTWGLLGACVMQLISHKDAKSRNTNTLQKESACVVLFTLVVLLLAAFLANTCVQILRNHGYMYIPGSYETLQTSQFLWPASEPMPGNMVSTPVHYMGHYGGVVGITVWRHGTVAKTVSGWEPLQLATQIVPATLAVLPPNMLSPIWAALFYFILIMFGIAQQLAIWHCVITGILAFNIRIMRMWDTTITFFSCVFGLAMGLLLSTDNGVRVVHCLDYVVVGGWWQGALHTALVIGVFAVRGRPLSADALVRTLLAARARSSTVLAALLSFIWTVVLPVVLAAICVMDFRVGQQRQLYSWKKATGYWPVWIRQMAVLTQQGILMFVPLTAFVQTWRYMNKGPSDIFERIQNLYRPHMIDVNEARMSPPSPAASSIVQMTPPLDPPPKYTPPPSYSTATGAKLFNTIRRSFRTLRRITTNQPASSDDGLQTPITLSESVDRRSQPPDYAQALPTISVTRECDHSTFTRNHLRRSFLRKTDSLRSIRSSLRRSFRYGGRTGSHERLVRHAEPLSTTAVMDSTELVETNETRARSLASVI